MRFVCCLVAYLDLWSLSSFNVKISLYLFFFPIDILLPIQFSFGTNCRDRPGIHVICLDLYLRNWCRPSSEVSSTGHVGDNWLRLPSSKTTWQWKITIKKAETSSNGCFSFCHVKVSGVYPELSLVLDFLVYGDYTSQCRISFAWTATTICETAGSVKAIWCRWLVVSCLESERTLVPKKSYLYP